MPLTTGLHLSLSFPSPQNTGLEYSDSINLRETFCAFANHDCKGHQGLYSVSLAGGIQGTPSQHLSSPGSFVPLPPWGSGSLPQLLLRSTETATPLQTLPPGLLEEGGEDKLAHQEAAPLPRWEGSQAQHRGLSGRRTHHRGTDTRNRTQGEISKPTLLSSLALQPTVTLTPSLPHNPKAFLITVWLSP